MEIETMGPEHFGGWSMFPGIMPVIMLVFMLVCVFFFMRHRGGGPPWMRGQGRSDGDASSGSESALDIVKKRYASGEISKEEYETLKQDLQE
jgi:putative membrane protein